jgi:hypothetical protein
MNDNEVIYLEKKEEVKKVIDLPLTVWDLKLGEQCWVITGKGSICEATYSPKSESINARRDKGDVFLTELDAQQALEVRKGAAKTNIQGMGEIAF